MVCHTNNKKGLKWPIYMRSEELDWPLQEPKRTHSMTSPFALSPLYKIATTVDEHNKSPKNLCRIILTSKRSLSIAVIQNHRDSKIHACTKRISFGPRQRQLRPRILYCGIFWIQFSLVLFELWRGCLRALGCHHWESWGDSLGNF